MNVTIQATRVPAHKFACLFAALILIAGCGGGAAFNQGTKTTASVVLKGKLLGGQYPVTSSEVQLYAVGSSGYGSGAQALLTPAVSTDQNGDFVITAADYKCPSNSTLTYLVATGGDPGLGSNNPAIALMAALGPCGSLSSLPSVQMNEVTTVASVWALAPFLGPGAQVGTSSTNAQGLENAFANVNTLVDLSNGTSPGTSAPTGAVIPVKKIYTMANILASCVNSDGTTACQALFTPATPPGGTAPSDTLDAALNIARNPSNNVVALSEIPTPQAPFLPGLGAMPPDWTLAMTYNGGGLNYPTSIAVDASGNVWAANLCGSDSPCSSVSEFSSGGQPLSSATGFTDGTLWESFGLAIDLQGNVWVTNEQTTSVNSGLGSISVLNSSGQITSPAGGYFAGGVDFPFTVATDAKGNIWTANMGDSSTSKLSLSGSQISGSGPFGTNQLDGAAAVAIDANNNAWFANQNADSGSVARVSSDGSQLTLIASGGDKTTAIATDSIGLSTGASKGHVWTANYGSSSVSELELNNDGSVSVVSTSGYTGGGLSYPAGIAVDGKGNVWVANGSAFGAHTITELQGANGANPGHAISSDGGFGADANLRELYGIAVDAGGNVWVSDFGSNTITQFLGVATPVKTPLVGPPQLP